MAVLTLLLIYVCIKSEEMWLSGSVMCGCMGPFSPGQPGVGIERYNMRQTWSSQPGVGLKQWEGRPPDGKDI